MQATVQSGDFSKFSQTNALTGSLDVTSGGYGDPQSARASYSGGGANGYARGIFNVSWQQGDEVWYGGAFYLPAGFHNAMQGQVALMRWDNWPSNPSGADQGGIVINGGDRHSYLERDHESSGSWSQTDLVGPFDLPEGRWFWLEVHQRFSSTAGGVSEVYLDGNRVGTSTAANMFGRPIERIRYGLVAIAESAQTNPLSLQFDRATVATSETGPVSGLTSPSGAGSSSVSGAAAPPAAVQPTAGTHRGAPRPPTGRRTKRPRRRASLHGASACLIRARLLSQHSQHSRHSPWSSSRLRAVQLSCRRSALIRRPARGHSS